MYSFVPIVLWFLQIDYIQEAKNTKQLKYNFRNEDIVVIPEIYNSSSNFIIMSYHEAKKFSQVSEHSQLLASMYMNFIYLTSILVHDYLHADLHQGNWKIIEHENDIQILIYDCGIMCSTNDLNLNKKIIDIVSSGRRKFFKMFDIISDSKSKVKIDKYRKELETIIDTGEENMSTTECFTRFLRKLIDLRLLNDKNLINMLTSISIIGDTPNKSISIFTKYILYPTGTNSLLFHIYIDILNKMNKFTEFKNFLINYLDDDPGKKQLYQDWLFEEFGHRKAYILTDIIYNQFFPKS
jgi:hypothetical protein